MAQDGGADLYRRLKADLTEALKARDRVSASALRIAIAAIENAGAVPAGPSMPEDLAPADVPRREVTQAEMARLLESEITELASAIERYDSLGQEGAAEEARAHRTVLEKYRRP